MKRINTSPISGAQELLPAAQATFDKLKGILADVYHMYGFLSIETPAIERCEILLAKAGGDTEKQIYKVSKTAESSEVADQALRFDHTVPLARYVVEHESDLAFPFKVSQIGESFRGERAQKGRFREFYQCDADVIGRGELPLEYDADVISTFLDALSRFELGTPVLARINNRKILSGLLEALGIADRSGEVFDVIDHAEKVTPEETKDAFLKLGFDGGMIAKLVAFSKLHGEREFVVKNLSSLGINNETFNTGVAELDKVMRLLELDGRAGEIEADMKIVRGLDYYTGTVFEFILPEYRQIGSVCGGGRYENLTGYFSEQSFPGVGGSIGLTRLFYVLNENNLVKSQEDKPIDYAMIPISENELEYAMKLAREFRSRGESVMIVPGDKKLGDKMKYAAKIAKRGIVLGENEVQSGVYDVKEFF